MNVFFRQTLDGYEWLQTSDDAIVSEYHAGSLDKFAQFYSENSASHHWVLVTSALDIIHRYFNYSSKEKKHIEKAVPFMLEEDVISDIEDLHFITNKTDDNQLAVIAVDKQLMGGWISELREKGITPSHCLSPYHLMPETESDFLLVYHSGEFLIKTPERLLAIDAEGLPACLELLTDNFASLPKKIELVVFSDTDEERANSVIPESLHHLIACRQMDYGKLLQNEFTTAKQWDMLTGTFALSNNWSEILKPWRWVILGFFLVYVADLGITAFESYRYQEQSKAVNVATDKLFRQVVPRGVIVDHRRQLGKLLSTAGNKNQVQFSNLLASMMPTLIETSTEVNSLSYDSNKAEFRLDLVVENFTVLETMMNKLKDQGIKSEISNSSQQDDKLRVRLRVEG